MLIHIFEIFFVVWKYNMILFFIFFVWMKTRYLKSDLYFYSIKIQTNINQNAVNYLRKIIDFEKNFSKNFFIFGLGPTQPMWLGWTQPPVHGHWPKPVTQTNHARVKWPKPVTRTNHARVKLYACMEQCEGNYIIFALFMLVFADNDNVRDHYCSGNGREIHWCPLLQINIIITTRTASILDENVRINSKTKIHWCP